MTRVLWLVPNKPDNISTGRQRIAQGLRNRGHTVTLRQDRKTHAKTQSRLDFDVLMASSAAGGLFGPPARLFQRTPFIMDHVDPIRQMYVTANRRNAWLAHALQFVGFRVADGIFYVYDEERPRFDGLSARVEQTTLGVDYDRFADTPSAFSLAAVEAQLDAAGIEPGFATYIGGLEPIYHVPELLHAAARGGWPLVLAGTGHYDDKARRYADAHTNIAHLGVLDHAHIPALLHYAGAGVCLVDDPHTVKVLEYAAAGLPVVHVAGRAMRTLPTGAVHWVAQDRDGVPIPGEITRAVRAAFDDGDGFAALREHAEAHDYAGVVAQYDRMVREVTA